MLKSLNYFILSVVFAFCVLFCCQAQNDPRDKNIAYLNLKNVEIREALDALIQNVDVSVSVDGGVQGIVSVFLENQPFESVLRNMLNQVNATYRVQDGIYEIVARKKQSLMPFNASASAPEVAPAGSGIRRIQIRSADPALIVQLLSAGFTGDWKVGPEISLLSLNPSTALTGGGFNSGFGGGRSGGKSGIGGIGNID